MKYEKIEPTGNYSYKIFTFKTKSPDRIVPPHWHESAELLFCLSGALEINVSGLNSYLEPRDMIFINSNHVHSSSSPIVGDFLAIQFPLDYLKQVTENNYFKKFLFNPNKINSSQVISDHLSEISSKYNNEDLGSHLFVKAKIYEVLSILCNDYIIPFSHIKEIKSMKYLNRLKAINEYIEDNYLRELTMVEVAETFNYNSSYFSRFYKQFMGITFSEYLNSLRLESAFKQLRDTDQTILKISYNSGFSNVKTFYNVFTKNFGLSPQQYREKYFKK